MRRIKAVVYSLWFGMLPWQWYEKECHYKGISYWYHLYINLTYAMRWALFIETDWDREFEKKANG